MSTGEELETSLELNVSTGLRNAPDPLVIWGEGHTQLLRIDATGQIFLRGKLIATDAEVAQKLNDVWK